MEGPGYDVVWCVCKGYSGNAHSVCGVYADNETAQHAVALALLEKSGDYTVRPHAVVKGKSETQRRDELDHAAAMKRDITYRLHVERVAKLTGACAHIAPLPEFEVPESVELFDEAWKEYERKGHEIRRRVCEAARIADIRSRDVEDDVVKALTTPKRL